MMLLAVTLLCCVAGALAQNGCRISVRNATGADSLASPAPLLIAPGGPHDVFGFLQPAAGAGAGEGAVTVRPGGAVVLACPGPQNYLRPVQPTPVRKDAQLVQEATATCGPSGRWTVANRSLAIGELSCLSYPSHIARKTGAPCNNDKGAKIGVMIEVGFEVPTKGFYKLIDICFDEATKSAVYSRCDLVPGILGAQTGNYHPAAYLQGKPPFYGDLVPRDLYRQIRESSNVSFLLGGKNFTLIRGHLTSGLDFVYKAHKRTTFYYANVAPQWETIKEKNWNKLEADVRSLAASRGAALHVYTGTHGVLALPGGRDIFLWDEGAAKRAIAVPKYFWKVVYEPKSRAGVAVVSVNSPYPPGAREAPLCPDVSARVPWFKWNAAKPEWGVGYVCDVASFRQAVGALPASVAPTQLLV